MILRSVAVATTTAAAVRRLIYLSARVSAESAPFCARPAAPGPSTMSDQGCPTAAGDDHQVIANWVEAICAASDAFHVACCSCVRQNIPKSTREWKRGHLEVLADEVGIYGVGPIGFGGQL